VLIKDYSDDKDKDKVLI